MWLLPKFFITCQIISGARPPGATITQEISGKLGIFVTKNSFEPLDSEVKEASTDLLFSSLALIYRDPARNNQQGSKERPQVDRYTTTHFLLKKPERGGGGLWHSLELGLL
jgi:hypothetical protein